MSMAFWLRDFQLTNADDWRHFFFFPPFGSWDIRMAVVHRVGYSALEGQNPNDNESRNPWALFRVLSHPPGSQR
jgi:hypothetical protein